ncbi:MAG TPA: hypothetical protein VG387_04160 [Rhizomicrobium sp.]|jgi:hypothetical protein|nr:hypothetical protein [Rhizomicrobium sp.]
MTQTDAQGSEFDAPMTRRIVAFLREIGLAVRAGTVAAETALPGIDIDRGTLVVDESRMTYPGDLLHEAGHLAVTTPARRAAFHHDVGNAPSEEMAAIAWSYAAALHIGIAPQIVFHDGGYRGGSKAVLASFEVDLPPGVPILAWLGMTHGGRRSAPSGTTPFPHMTNWLCLRETLE